MAKRKSQSSELNLDSLMDTVTNVVGVLMIVFIMVSLNIARTVNRILSELPPVTEEEHQRIKEQVKNLPPPPADPKQLVAEQTKTEEQLKQITEKLKTVDTTDALQKIKFMDLDELRKKIEATRKDRDVAKTESDKLLTEIERLKALLDQTPQYKPPPPTYVRLPNPRPYPEKPNETRVLVAKEGVLIFNESEYLAPIISGLEKVRSQIEYKDAKFEPFAAMLEKILGSKAEAQKAWPELAPLAGIFQMELVAQAYKALSVAGIAPTKDLLGRLGDISLVIRQPLPEVAAAVAAATQGDPAKWTALDPSKDPAKPIIKATAAGNKITFSYGAKAEEVRATPREVIDYFRKLADGDAFKNAAKSKVIYDAFRMVEVLQRAASSQVISQAFAMKPTIRPGSANVQLQLVPKSGSGQAVEQLQQPNSAFIRRLRDIKADPNGVALFQVMPDAFTTYLEARRVADEIGVPATWEFLRSLDLAVNVTGFEVQRFAPTAPRAVTGAATAVSIAPPKKTLD